jgi:hypothetical protein
MEIDELIHRFAKDLEHLKRMQLTFENATANKVYAEMNAKINAQEILKCEIALATLKLHKEGYVMVPSEGTDEMDDSATRARYEWGYKLIKGEVKGTHDIDSYKSAIKARPTTELDELLKGVD